MIVEVGTFESWKAKKPKQATREVLKYFRVRCPGAEVITPGGEATVLNCGEVQKAVIEDLATIGVKVSFPDPCFNIGTHTIMLGGVMACAAYYLEHRPA